MNKKSIVILVIGIVLIAVAIYCVPYFLVYRSAKVTNIKYSGISDVLKKLDSIHPKLRKKKYYYFSSWNTRCGACIEEMPRLDSMAGNLSTNIGFIYVSDDSQEKAKSFLKRKNISSKNFTYLNDMDGFISAVYKTQGIKYKVFPTHFVTDSSGKILIFKQGSLSYGEFRKGHVLTKADSLFIEKQQDPIVIFLKKIQLPKECKTIFSHRVSE
jgi:thiol-disulfide isomerase/thioredoxin